MNSHLPGRMTVGKTGDIYLDLLRRIRIKPWKASRFMLDLLKEFKQFPMESEQSRKAVAGGVFEFGLAECLIKEGIGPFYFRAKLENVPIHSYDLLLYHKTAPVVISAKVSTAERWKQAAYEGLALEGAFPNMEQYLVLGTSKGPARISKYIAQGIAPGLNGCLDATTSDMDELLTKLARKKARSRPGFQLAKSGIKSKLGPLGPS